MSISEAVVSVTNCLMSFGQERLAVTCALLPCTCSCQGYSMVCSQACKIQILHFCTSFKSHTAFYTHPSACWTGVTLNLPKRPDFSPRQSWRGDKTVLLGTVLSAVTPASFPLHPGTEILNESVRKRRESRANLKARETSRKSPNKTLQSIQWFLCLVSTTAGWRAHTSVATGAGYQGQNTGYWLTGRLESADATLHLNTAGNAALPWPAAAAE